MNVFSRLEMIYESLIGQILLGFLIFLCLLLIIYLVLRLRQRQKDALAFRFQVHYDSVQKLLPNWNFIGKHKADIFGRKTIVQGEDDGYAYCLIPPPDLIDDEVLGRFRRYQRAVEHQELPVFTRYIFSHEEDPLILIQDQMVRGDGRIYSTLKEFCMDKNLGYADAELILLEIARALATLQELKTDQGEQLYYGFLMPRSIFLNFDSNKRINKVVLPDAGFAFALGPKKICQRLAVIKGKGAFIGDQIAKELDEQKVMLAPEQRDEKRIEDVGTAVDFYAFAALCINLLTQKPFTGAEVVDWNEIPQKWRSFLKGCFDENPNKRPDDFLSLQDLLYDPDLALTHHQSDEEFIDDDAEEDAVTLDQLAGVLQNAESFQKKEEKGDENVLLHISKARSSIKNKRWAIAKTHLKRAYEAAPDDAEVNVYLAIVHYEQGAFEEAERFYEEAKKCDAPTAKRFREHIAFRV